MRRKERGGYATCTKLSRPMYTFKELKVFEALGDF